jgi:small-conductance mechanosensitive channel
MGPGAIGGRWGAQLQRLHRGRPVTQGLIAGLGIGGLAFGLAAQPMISDIVGAVIIFAEGRFRIGDVVGSAATSRPVWWG